MKPWLKTLITIVCILTIVLLIVNYFKNDDAVDKILGKLDTTQTLLDSATARIKFSRTTISEMQKNLNSYSQQVHKSDSTVEALVLISNRKENEFLKKASVSNQNIIDMKQKFTKRTFWPDIVIDTSHFNLPNAD